MIDFPFQTYLFIYSLCTTPEFSEKQNKHYLKICCFLFFSLWKENLTGKSYCCVSCFVWHTFIYPKACLILPLLWKLVISIQVAFLCTGLISVDQSYWLIENSPLPSSIYILGANRLGGETTRGAKRLGGKRLWGETTRRGNGLGAKRPGFRVCTVCHSICILWKHYSMVSHILGWLQQFFGVQIFTVPLQWSFLYRKVAIREPIINNWSIY